MSILHPKNLRILYWNPRSIANKKEEVSKILNDLDIFVCVESWLNKDTNFHFTGFKTFRKDRTDKNGGGIVLLIRNNLAYKEKENLNIPHTSVEIASITITNVKPALNLIVCYRAPSVTLTELQWDQILSNINKSSHTIFLGDFNAHHMNWNCNKTDTNGKNFYESLLKTNLFLHNDKSHTYIQPHINYTSNIDLIFSSTNLSYRLNVKVKSDTWGSDHFPISIDIDLE